MLFPSLATDHRNRSLLRLYSARLGTMVNRRLSKVALKQVHGESGAESQTVAADARLPFLEAMNRRLAAPLSSLTGCAEEMFDGAHGPVTPAYHEHVRYMVELGRQLLAAMSDVFDAARIETEGYRLEERELDLGKVIAALLPLFEIDAAEAGIEVRVQLPPDLPPLRADIRAVRFVIAALLHESLSQSVAGARIEIGAAIEAGGALNLSITRSGAAAADGPADAALHAAVEKLLALHEALLLTQPASGLGAVAAIIFPLSRVVKAPPSAAPEPAPAAAF